MSDWIVTTLKLSREVLKKAKIRAIEKESTLQEVVDQALRKELGLK